MAKEGHCASEVESEIECFHARRRAVSQIFQNCHSLRRLSLGRKERGEEEVEIVGFQSVWKICADVEKRDYCFQVLDSLKDCSNSFLLQNAQMDNK